jgi:steroid delta-isomerase-like uncharacterized protein
MNGKAWLLMLDDAPPITRTMGFYADQRREATGIYLLEQAEQFFTALNAKDVDTMVAMLSPSVNFSTPIGSFTGQGAYREWVSQQFRTITGFTHKIRGIIAESDQTIAFEVRATGTHTGPLALPSGEVPASGRSINMSAAIFLRFENGLIVEYHLYFDHLELLRQVGAFTYPKAS